jgi:hypothetical protein
MIRTATRVAAAVGATVVMMGLAAPALACTTTEAGGRSSAVVSSFEAKNDPGKAFHKAKHDPSLTLADLQAKLDAKFADKLAWLDKIEAKVSASNRLSDEQKTAVLARLQSSEDALTQLRADVAAATSVDAVKAALKAADVNLFRGWGWHHGNCDGNRHHNGDPNQNQRRGGDRHGGDRHAGGFHHNGGDRHSGGSNHGGGFGR